MALVKYCALAALVFAALQSASAEDFAPSQRRRAAENSAATPATAGHPSVRNPSEPDHHAAPSVTAADARELAAWAKQHGGDLGELGISLEDAQELEAWAQQREQEQARRAAEVVPPAQVQQTAFPQVSQRDGNHRFVSQPGAGGPNLQPYGGNPYSYNSSPYGHNAQADAGPSGPVMAAQGGAAYEVLDNGAGPNEHLPPPGDIDNTGEEYVYDDSVGKDLLWGKAFGNWQQWCAAGLVGGAELSFLYPYGEPSQFVTLTDLLTNDAFTGTADPGLATGVRFWLGFQHASGFGYRVRYAHIGNDLINNDPVVPIISNGVAAFHESYQLRADTIDLEITHRYCIKNWRLDTSFGARYARLERNATVLGFGTLGDVDLLGLAVGSNSLEGMGFTASIGGRSPIGLRWAKHKDKDYKAHPPFDKIHSGIAAYHPELLSGWSWYWGVRASVLWASTTASAFTEASAVVKAPIGAASANSRDKAFASKDHNDTVVIGEAVLGVQWEKCCKCIPASCFFRAGLEYQHWETGDVFASSNSFAFLHDGPTTFGGRVDASANATDGNLDLFGIFIGAGITY